MAGFLAGRLLDRGTSACRWYPMHHVARQVLSILKQALGWVASSSDQRPPFRVCLKSILVLSPHRALFGFTYLVMFLLPSFILMRTQ
eukprot:scaffold595_cov72-Phaeocystis_antarctica.AAC.1